MLPEPKPLLVPLHNALVVDVEHFQSQVHGPGATQVARRAYLRAICALLDAMAFGLLEYVRSIPWAPMSPLTPAERESLEDAKQPTRKAFKTRVKICFKYQPWAELPRFDTAGWGHLRHVFDIRNRVTHPKDAAAVDISDDDMAIVCAGARWYIDSMSAFLQTMQDRDRAKPWIPELRPQPDAAGSDVKRAMRILIKAPDECSEEERETFCKLVREGGEVQGEGLETLVGRAQALVLIEEGGDFVGTAGLKTPRPSYRDDVFAKARAPVHAGAFPFEVGWIYLREGFRDRKLSPCLVAAALSRAKDGNVFATSNDENTAMHKTLRRFGFSECGVPYRSGAGECLRLFVRMPLLPLPQ